jgi:hypothetical protein
MLFNLIAGALLTAYHSYVLIFTILGLLHPLSFITILLVVRRVEPVVNLRLGQSETALS